MPQRHRPETCPPDRLTAHSWESRVTALRQEKPANWAMAGALFAMLAATMGWLAVLVPTGGTVRGNPVFWLLCLPLMGWTNALVRFRPWVVNSVWIALLLAPSLSVAALVLAQHLRDADPLLGPSSRLDTPVAMGVILAITLLLSAAGGVALRASSLPGGLRPVRYLPPGTLPRGSLPPLSDELLSAVKLASLAFSGVLINGSMFAITATMADADYGQDALHTYWPLAIPLTLIVLTAILVFRGIRVLVRRRDAIPAELRVGLSLGASGCVLMLVLLWVWPQPILVKEAFSVVMAPLALAAALCTWWSLRLMREAIQS
ncbi:MAG: hypothetical protein ACRYHQ_20345 [Janthinobacterium lividum]